MKKTFPDHIRQLLLVTPPPRHACSHCGHLFHVAEFLEDGSPSPTWDEGLCIWQNGERVCDAFFIVCPKCKNATLPFIVSEARNIKDLAPAKQPGPALTQITPPEPPREAPRTIEVKIPPPPAPAPAKKPPTPAELLSGKYRK